MIKGRCECGKVVFKVTELRETVTVCHCSQCRRTSGHIWASTNAPNYDALQFEVDEGLKWYNSSDIARRGFCQFCGSSLFYQKNDEEVVSIAAGCIDAPTGLHVTKHIFVKDKGDYYTIGNDGEQLEKN